MATVTAPPAGPETAWYQLSPKDVAAKLGVEPTKGLTAAQVAEATKMYGPNALPAEKPKPGWRRFVDEYRSYLLGKLVYRRLTPSPPDYTT
jgi:Ca2+-transporting ATPase